MKEPRENKKRNQRYDAKFKERAVKRMMAGENVSALSRELGLRRNQLYRWRDAKVAGRPFRGSGRPKGQDAGAAPTSGERQIAELHRLVGQLTEENRFFKGALQRIKEIRQPYSVVGVKGSASKSGSRARRKAN